MSDDYKVENGEFERPNRTEDELHCSPDEAVADQIREADSFFPPADADHSHEYSPPRAAGPLPGSGVEPEPEPTGQSYAPVWSGKPQKSGSAALKAVIITLCVLVAIAVSAMIFMGTGEVRISIGGTPDPGSDMMPGDNGEFDSYEDFFNAYYSEPLEGRTGIETVGAAVGTSFEIVPAAGERLDLIGIYEKCAPSVVGIKAGVETTELYWGTGIIFSADGYIVTNYHIIENADLADVVLSDGTEYPAKLVGFDADSDLAVLRIGAEALPTAEFGDSAELMVGEEVAAIGNPLGIEFSGTLTNGIISAINRNVEHDGHSMTLLQTNAAINEGNSGGPLINMYGQVVGITNMKMISSDSSIEGIGFAIPSRSIKTIVDELLKNGYVTGKPAIGITIGAMPEGIAEEYGIPNGLYISGVEKTADAYRQGVQVGDILTHVNGVPVSSSDEVAEIKNRFSAGDKLTLTLYRDGGSFDVDITLHENGEIFGG